MSPEVVTLSDAILFSLVTLALILGCALLLDSNRSKDRAVFGTILILMLANYVYFRLTTTLPYMKVVVSELVKRGMRDDYIVLVGGAPLNEEFGKAVGADAYSRDAANAVETATRHVEEHRTRVAV